MLYCWSNTRYKNRENLKNKRKKYLRSVFVVGKGDKGEKCVTSVVDSCKWPNCNQSCPNARHPFTGEEINPIELFNFYDGISNLNSNKVLFQMNDKRRRMSKLEYQELMKSNVS
jgi:hypothetical protein